MFGIPRLRPRPPRTVVQVAHCTKVLWLKGQVEVEIQPLFHLPSQLPMEICLLRGGHHSLIFTKAPCEHCCSSASNHCVTLGKVISLLGLGFPFEKLSSIKQKFNPDGELESPGTFKNY